MKKLFTILAVCVFALSGNARGVDVESSEILDNISIGISGGVYTTPLSCSGFFGNMRPVVSLTIAKQITPIYGLGIEGTTAINANTLGVHSHNVFDVTTVNLTHYVNLTNLVLGYQGQSRAFEISAFYGLGWGHAAIHDGYVEENGYVDGNRCVDHNFLSSKTGLKLDFNLGEERAWQINFKPAVAWNMGGDGGYNNSGFEYCSNHAAFEIQVGVTYKFKNSNGTHEFKEVKPYDQAEIDALNAKINALNGDVDRLNGENARKDGEIKRLQDALNECRNRPVPQPEPAKVEQQLESYVHFKQGKATIDQSQMPNVERIATYLKNHPEATVEIKGYASPEGSAEINERLANQRAEAVKTQLIKKYKIDESRISAKGLGVGDVFEEPDWNRVSISTIQK